MSNAASKQAMHKKDQADYSWQAGPGDRAQHLYETQGFQVRSVCGRDQLAKYMEPGDKYSFPKCKACARA
jgi:hypothetical protein